MISMLTGWMEIKMLPVKRVGMNRTFSISDNRDKDEESHESFGKRKMAAQGGAGGKGAKV